MIVVIFISVSRSLLGPPPKCSGLWEKLVVRIWLKLKVYLLEGFSQVTFNYDQSALVLQAMHGVIDLQ